MVLFFTPITMMNMMKFVVVVLTVVVCNVSAKPSETFDAVTYLEQFNYLKDSDNSSLTDAVRQFQEDQGLEVTGELDNETKIAMSKPLFEVSFEDSSSHSKVVKRSAGLIGTIRHGIRQITYRVRWYGSKLTRGQVDRVMAAALSKWSRYIPVKFVLQNQGIADINIWFVNFHCDGVSYKTNSHTVLHACSRVYQEHVIVHFDKNESWYVDGKAKGSVNLLQVATHFFGQSLGLSNSNVYGAVMYGYYIRTRKDIQLHEDDIKRVQKLYGTRITDIHSVYR